MAPCLHQCNVSIKRKLKVCSAQKCNPCFCANSPLRSTDQQRTRFHAAPYRADSTNLRKFGVAIVMVPCLHNWNDYIKRKLRVCSAQKCNPCFGAKSPLRSTDLQEPGSMHRRIGPTVQICVNSGLAIAMVPCLHQWNDYIKRKLRVCSAQKCNSCFDAKSPLRSTDLVLCSAL